MFKKMIVAGVMLSSLLQANELHVEKSFYATLKKSSQEHKPVMFIVSRHTCKYCVILEKEVLSDKAVIDELNKSFVSMIAYTDDGTKFPREYNTGGTPTIWFLSEDGKPLFQPVRGAVSLSNFKMAMDQVKAEYARVHTLTTPKKKTTVH